MLIRKIYNAHTREQRAWYDSSMFYFTSMVEDEFENKGDLTVVFKNGSTYRYKDVRFEDYMLLLAGGTDASNGKTLNKNIKSKYEYEKLDDTNIADLEEELRRLIAEENQKKLDISNTYFISGHRDITDEEFDINYVPILTNLAEEYDAKFVVGDYYGTDIMAQNFLMDEIGLDPERITVYHMFESPRNINEKITNKIGGFQSDEERDAAMTAASSTDVAFVRDHTKISGTAQNILRRFQLITVS